jgi:hypothetical protein
MNELIDALSAPNTRVEMPLSRILELLAHATGVGIYLMGLTAWVDRKTGSDLSDPDWDPVLGPASTLFLSIGMCAVMILVSDSLARAFAIGAAIALVRFRVNMVGRFVGISLLYGVLTGMACGLGRADIAWILAILFGTLIAGVVAIRSRIRKRELRGLEASADDLRKSA